MFTPMTLDFLADNCFMNSREWYQEHKEDYKNFVLRPLVEMVEALAPTMEKIDSFILTEPKVDKTISRIYRDARYAKGVLYREEVWLTFKRDKHMFPGYPEFFFALSPKGFCYGCGYYAAPAATMECMRNLVYENHPAYLAAEKAYQAQSSFYMDGYLYKRSKRPDASPEQRNWIDRKTICLFHDGDPITELFSDSLYRKVADDFMKISPAYHLFIEAEQQSNELLVY